MTDYTQTIGELKAKISAGETGAKEASTVSVTDWQGVGKQLTERFEDYSTKVKRLETQKQVDDLKAEAQGEIDNFNQFVRDLETNNMYTEDAKRLLYKEQYKTADNALKALGEKQRQLLNEIVDLSQTNAKKAYEDLKTHATAEDLTPQDFSYINLMLSRDNSFKARQGIAEKYNYHFAVLDILNAGVSKVRGENKIINHPLEYMKDGLTHYGVGYQDFFLQRGGVYAHEVLRKLNNKLFNESSGNTRTGIF